MLLEISQNSQENICARVSLLINCKPSLSTLLIKRLRHSCFPVNLTKFLKITFLTEHLQWLFLAIVSFSILLAVSIKTYMGSLRKLKLIGFMLLFLNGETDKLQNFDAQSNCLLFLKYMFTGFLWIGCFENLSNFTGKYLWWRPLVKLQAVSYFTLKWNFRTACFFCFCSEIVFMFVLSAFHL